MMPDTIFVAPQGLGTAADAADTGWPNTGGQDIAFVRALMTSLERSYCIDQRRIFSTGFSYGGIMSHTIGCQMSDVFRAIAPMAGAMFGRPTCLTHPIAAWMTHGTMDTSASGGVDYSAGQTARDRIVTLNHCQSTTTAVTPTGCVSYDGCDAGNPVHWCPHAGAHMIPSFAAAGHRQLLHAVLIRAGLGSVPALCRVDLGEASRWRHHSADWLRELVRAAFCRLAPPEPMRSGKAPMLESSSFCSSSSI